MAIVQEGGTPLPWCPICGIHMHMVKMIRNQRTDRCNWVMEIWMQRHNMEISQRAGEMKFSLCDREGNPLLEGVA